MPRDYEVLLACLLLTIYLQLTTNVLLSDHLLQTQF